MEATPTISVVLPVLNGGEFVDAAIQSIVDQDFRDWELICVDDGSTDDSLSRMQSWASRDPRITVIEHPHDGGNYAARNAGLAHARGTWIATMDADDLSLPNRFERQLDYAAEHPDVDMVGSRIFVFVDDPAERLAPAPRGGGLAYGAMPAAHATMMFRRTLFTAYGCYDESFRLSGDHELIVRFAHAGARAGVVDEPLYLVRRHGSNITLQNKKVQTRGTLRVYWRIIFRYRMRLHPKGYLLALEYLLQYLYLVLGFDHVIPRRWMHKLLRRELKSHEPEQAEAPAADRE